MADTVGLSTSDPDSSNQPSSTDSSLSIQDLVRTQYSTAFGYAFRLAGNAADAEDIAQQAFLIAQRKLDQLREPAKADRWMCSIVRTCFLKSRRRQRPLTGIELAVDEIPDSRTREPIDHEQLQLALNQLPPEFRVVLAMFYFEDLSYQEIADELEMPIGTVMSRLSRAKGRLRKLLLESEDVAPSHKSDRGAQPVTTDAGPDVSKSNPDRT